MKLDEMTPSKWFKFLLCLFAIGASIAFLEGFFSAAHAHTCDELIAADARATIAATERLKRDCPPDPVSDRCTRAIKNGDKVYAASKALDLSCPSVSWSYDPPPPWRPE